jgi:hypothetical protein
MEVSAEKRLESTEIFSEMTIQLAAQHSECTAHLFAYDDLYDKSR